MAGLGFGFAVFARSDAIMLDGAFSLIGFCITLLAMRVAALVEQPGSKTFQFGYAHFEPLFNLGRGLIILILCVFALVSAVESMLQGGRPLDPGLGAIYAGIVVVGSLVVVLLLSRAVRETRSPTLQLDRQSWLLDAMITAGVGIAFVIGHFLEDTSFAHLVPYLDPALIAILVLVLVPQPLSAVWQNLGDVLLMAPDRGMQAKVHDRIAAGVPDLAEFPQYIRMVRLGRSVFVKIHVVLPESHPLERVGQMDELRRDIVRALDGLHPRLQVDAMVTSDLHYAETGHTA